MGENSIAIGLIVKNIINIIYSSDESDDDEYVFINLLKQRGSTINRPRLKNYVESVVPLYTDAEFKQNFRMRRETFHFLLDLVHPALQKRIDDNNICKKGRNTICPEKQLLLAIWVFATPDSYRSVRNKFDVGQATAIRIVRRVTKALVHLAPNFIKWPTEEEIVDNSAKFYAKTGFPGVLGAIDGTHIRIAKPKEDHNGYINRKGYHSIQLQVICDNSMRFIHCYAGYPGSVHDQRVFSLSGVQNICNDDSRFPGNTHLIGDCAYMIQQHLLVPYTDNGHLTLRQKNYNYCLSSTRMVVERSIGLLKGRFRSLLDKLPMTRTDLIPDYILACCVLHNICILQNDMIDIPLIVPSSSEHFNERNFNFIPIRREEGTVKRNEITNILHMRL